MSDGIARLRGAVAGLFAALIVAAAHAPAIAAAPATSAGTNVTAPLTPDAQSPVLTPAPSSGPLVPPSAAASEAGEDIRDIRGPKVVYPAWLVPAVLAGSALLALLGYFLWRRISRPHPRVLSLAERTLQQLEEIRALMQLGAAREFSIAVSDIVRRYIEQRFDVTATHRTTEEFLRDLLESSNPSLARHRGLLSAFLHQCDLVKFAGMSLSLQSMESLHASARAFVLETAKPDAPAPADAAAAPEAHDSLPANGA